MTDTIFDEDIVNNTSALDRLVGEGKKFKDVEALARSREESESFSESLKRELREAREDRARLQAELEAKNASTQRTNQSVEEERSPNNQSNQAAVNVNDIAAIVRNTLTEEQVRKNAQANLQYCADELKKMYGENFVEKLRSHASSLGLTEAYVDDLASKSPKALLAMLGGGNSKVDVSAPRSSIMSKGLGNTNTGQKDWAYYQKLRIENPKLYHNAKTQMEIHKRALAGELQIPSE